MSTYILIFLIFSTFEGFGEAIELKIEAGTILGRRDLTEDLKQQYYVFQGIPYAEPPKRFELPVLKKPWSGVLNCTFEKSQCVQLDSASVSGSEDCLFLNVYSRKLLGNASVMVFIHGGGFILGNGSYSFSGPDYFLEENLIVVTIQYRLGIFGFMSTGDLVSPGNLGLKDQVLALQWVQRNIRYFGGNPQDVTIFGQSAGAASVALHLNSPKTKGLFKGAIMNSGHSLCLWSLNRRAVKTAFAVGFTLGIFTLNSSVLVNELKKVDYRILQDTSNKIGLLIMLENPLAGLSYGPVREIEHETAFFTGKSEEMLSKGNFIKIPVLAGYTSNETATFNTPEVSPILRLYFLKYDFDWQTIVPADLTASILNRISASFEIKQEFFGKSLLSAFLGPQEDIFKFLNVDQFIRPTHKFISDVGKYVSNTFYYMFSYMGDFRKNLGLNSEGVQHAEDLNYLFPRDIQFSPQDKLMRKCIVRMWANFCKYSSPVPRPDPLLQNVSWLPASSKQPMFLMNINTTMGSIPNPFQKSLDFYDQIYLKYGQGIYDTY